MKKLGLKTLSLCLGALMLTAGLCGCGDKENSKAEESSSKVQTETVENDSKDSEKETKAADEEDADEDTEKDDDSSTSVDEHISNKVTPLAYNCSNADEVIDLYGETSRIIISDIAEGMYTEPLEIEVSEDLCKEFATQSANFEDAGYGATPMYALNLYNEDGALIDVMEVSEYFSVSSTAGIYFDRCEEFEDWLMDVEEEYTLDYETVYMREPGDDYFALMERADVICAIKVNNNDLDDIEEYSMSPANEEKFIEALEGCSFEPADEDLRFEDLNIKYGILVLDDEESELYAFYITDSDIYTSWGYKVVNDGLYDSIVNMIKESADTAE